MVISEEQLLELQFSNHDIACLLGVSSRTSRRRIIQFRFQDQASYCDVDDTSLDATYYIAVCLHKSKLWRNVTCWISQKH